MNWTHGATSASLCPRCAAVDPGLHAAGPEGAWEVGVVALGLVIVAMALILAVKFLFRPGETAATHIKRAILDDSAPISQETGR